MQRQAPALCMRRTLKILMTTDVDPAEMIGGAERALRSQARELAARGHEVVVLARGDGTRSTAQTLDGFRIVRFSAPEGRGAAALWRTLLAAKAAADRQLAQESYDVQFIQQPLTGAGVLFSQAARALPAVYHYHSPWSEEYRIRALQSRLPLADPAHTRPLPAEAAAIAVRRRMEREVLQRSRRVILMTESMADICRRLHGIPQDKIVINPGGVDIDHFRPPSDRQAIRRNLGINVDEALVLTVRNLVPRMGLGNLLEAMERVLRSCRRCVCIIGGDGPLKDVLRRRAVELRLGDRVRFVGFIPEAELPDYYGAADLFVLPTIALEGFGLVTVEALACGTPVVGTPVGGTPEILRGLDPALILESAEPDAIACGILANLARVSGHADRRAQCREYAVANYSWRTVVDRIEETLQAVAEGRHTPL